MRTTEALEVDEADAATRRGRGAFGASVLKLVSGTGIAQALGILAAPVLTRLYAPEAFGIAGLFSALVAILAIAASLRYELAIMLPESDDDAASMLGVSLLMVAVTSVITAGLVLVAGDAIVALLNADGLRPYLGLIPLLVAATGAFGALNYWNSRTGRFGRLSVNRVVGSATTLGTQLAAGFAGAVHAGSLVGGRCLGACVSAGLLGTRIWLEDRRAISRGWRWTALRAGARRYRRFPLINTWSSLLNTASWEMPALILGALFSPQVVGFYALGQRLIRAPLKLVAKAVAQVFYPEAARARRGERLPDLTLLVFEYLLRIGLFPTLLLCIIGRDLFTFAFGERWAEAGVYTQLLAPLGLVVFISSPMSTIFSAVERQGIGLRIQVSIFTTRLVSLGAGGMLGSARIAIALFTASGLLTYGYLLYRVMDVAGVSPGAVPRALLRRLAEWLPYGAVVAALRMLGAPPSWVLGAAALAIALYYGRFAASDPRMRRLIPLGPRPGARA